jgi:hypothetical protein
MENRPFHAQIALSLARPSLCHLRESLLDTKICLSLLGVRLRISEMRPVNFKDELLEYTKMLGVSLLW